MPKGVYKHLPLSEEHKKKQIVVFTTTPRASTEDGYDRKDKEVAEDTGEGTGP